MATRVRGHKAHGRGTPQIDRTFPPPIGQIRIASGTHDRNAFAAIDAMLTALGTSIPPRYDVLLAVRDGRISPMHALSLWQLGRLHEVPQVESLPPLETRYQEWLRGLEVSDAYRAQITCTFRQLLALSSEATVGDVVELLMERREVCKAEGVATGFNRSKAHVQAFLRDIAGDDSPMYKAVTKIPTLEVSDDPVRRAQTPKALAALLYKLPEPHRAMAWSLAVTGMRPSEYFRQVWRIGGQGTQATHIIVDGTKRAASRRTVPLWVAGLPSYPQRSRDAFEGMWDRRLGTTLKIYDLRRSFAVWMEDAGIPRSRRKIYLGHAAGDITGLYEQRELNAWRSEDSAMLWKFAGKWMPRDASAAPNAVEELLATIPEFHPDTI